MPLACRNRHHPLRSGNRPCQGRNNIPIQNSLRDSKTGQDIHRNPKHALDKCGSLFDLYHACHLPCKLTLPRPTLCQTAELAP